ncbi:MAG: hypothetical protein HOV79_10780 [Hamadaea sp.]|nr:hypothetical protein [Hamadaea sp.]
MRPGERHIRLHRTRLLLTSLALVGGWLLSGCGGGAPAIDRTDLANDLAARLTQATSADYTARYQLAGGAEVTVSQTADPRRSAYRWGNGALIYTPDAITKCDGAPQVCRMTAAPTAGPSHPNATELLKHGLLTPQKASALLTAAALDLTTDISQRDTTIAGQPSTCLEVASTRDDRPYEFDICVTTDGVLGSFAGTVDGTPIDLAMTHYSRTVPTEAFATATPSISPL